MSRRIIALCLWGALALLGCQPNFIVRHKSLRSVGPVQVYVNRKAFCVAAPGRPCKARLKPGRYSFYARTQGKKAQTWGDPQAPTPFAVDRKTVIVLHDKDAVALPPAMQKALKPKQTLLRK